ncbi:MAG TPA: hypothetical protein DCY07_01970 [Rhodospirillaceae bacterium]|nr:hypothetical protein [Rhodospirillaceae bacterium]
MYEPPNPLDEALAFFRDHTPTSGSYGLQTKLYCVKTKSAYPPYKASDTAFFTKEMLLGHAAQLDCQAKHAGFLTGERAKLLALCRAGLDAIAFHEAPPRLQRHIPDFRAGKVRSVPVYIP